MKYAIIENGFVTNVAMANSPLTDNWIQSDVAGIGWTYENGTFTEPVASPQEVIATPWTKKEFLLKFTPAEYAAIKGAAAANAEIDYYWTLFNVAEFVDKTDPTTIAGITALETSGVLANGRAQEILT